VDNQHEKWMRRALALARHGIALSSPNPCVGAVLVDADGQVLGEGTHTYEGVKHAEVLAIEAATRAGHSVRGATLYLNLEPCCHTGRTGPCVEAVVAAGITRVVMAVRDPNPEVSGRSVERLRAAGVEVVEGIVENEARKLNESFAKFIRRRTPLVTLKAAMTLDGKIAPPPGDSVHAATAAPYGPSGGWITSEPARAHVQELRHASDAIMVGVGTVIADDPLLTDRTGRPRRRPLLRIILDSLLRLPLNSRVVETAKDDVLVLCAFAEETKKKALEERGVRVEQVALPSAASALESPKMRRMPVRRRTGTGKPIREAQTAEAVNYARPDLRRAMERLGQMEITSVLIEGGALVNWAALAAGVVDKVFLYYAPRILAGTGSVPFAAGTGFRKLSEAAHVNGITIHNFGDDFAIEGYLRDPDSD
jgi:diaminohydroxyphosphoribosylaminopyrimidine deaminase/5-amino-6-(5-phosphoribosylamino)uracil reductase